MYCVFPTIPDVSDTEAGVWAPTDWVSQPPGTVPGTGKAFNTCLLNERIMKAAGIIKYETLGIRRNRGTESKELKS